mmetsp:Transcript_97975/g.227191  ORF Transcript_97975/g.227191 Transcript_97975/m.227191 type:complete len:154 (-) Transcript_97975:161-622(-)
MPIASTGAAWAPQGGKPVDWPTDQWEQLVLVRRRLGLASEAMERIREEKQRKHVRQNRFEAAYDDLFAAERDMVVLQNALGLRLDEPAEIAEVAAALTTVTASSAAWLLLVGVRLGLPSGPWLHVLRSLLPVHELGYAPEPLAHLRLTMVQRS